MEALKNRSVNLPPAGLNLTPRSQGRRLAIHAGPTPTKPAGDEPFTPPGDNESVVASPEPESAPAPRISPLDDLIGDPFPRSRYRPNSTCSFLRPGAKFSGNQRSDKSEYAVDIVIQHVDMAESYMCGYLSIRGLTREFPNLTTYFEAEMIGSKYSFTTNHPEWGATQTVDYQHWHNFPPYRPLHPIVKRNGYLLKNWQQREHIWMRWKEYFLVPDHRVTDLENASFDGFYYICFNQRTGMIQGTYYHHKSER
jgi:hypothetical protein